MLALGAQAAWLGTRFLLADEMPIHEEYRRLLIAANETDAEWYANLYEVGWPDAPHRAIHNSTAERWEAAGRPAPGSRPGEGEVIAHFASGEPSFDIPPRPRSSAQPARSRRYRCGPDRASRSQNSHNQQRRSWPSSFALVAPTQVKASPRGELRATLRVVSPSSVLV